jgi:hypothetical protein
MKYICDKCQSLAVWLYMPSATGGSRCDLHVPRGCSCNINPDTGIEDVDERGRFLPCCEWDYDENGFDD